MTDSNVTPIPEIEAVEDEAREWIVRLEDGDATKEQLNAFEAWRVQSSLHREVFDRLSGFWSQSDVIKKLNDYGESEAANAALIHDRVVRTSRTVWRIAGGALAACFAAVAGLYIHSYTLGDNRSLVAEYQTSIGEQETIALPDGSSVTLNTDSALAVDYRWRERRIFLTEGEAFFDVASNKRRPFLVETKNGVVEAVGTAFSVRVDTSTLDVVVTEGRVSIAPLEVAEVNLSGQSIVTTLLSPVEVSARQMASFSNEAENVEPVSKREIDKQLDWRDGELSFEGETLETIVNEVSRYTDVSIEIDGDDLRTQRIVAYYTIGDIDPLIDALQVITGAEATYLDERTVRLSRGPSREL